MKRWLGFGVGTLLAVGGASALAASPARSEAGGTASPTTIVESCDSDGVRVRLATSWSTAVQRHTIGAAAVSELDAGCEGAKVLLAVRGDAARHANAVGVVRNGAAKLKFAAPLPAASAQEIELVVLLDRPGSN